jgi:hypothetical protein
MEAKKAGTSLESLMSSFNTRILELQDLVIARNSQSFFAFSHSLFRPITDVDVFNCFQCTRLRASPIYRRWTPH